jgi:hypothetical protein
MTLFQYGVTTICLVVGTYPNTLGSFDKIYIISEMLEFSKNKNKNKNNPPKNFFLG